ncbi:prostaglandin E synthase [Takifugu rubripes]|uniref:Prostaglandin E synthase n=1 Tax=Takifugu flavidus TaxID=433684 RepID=A0A5C6NL32_9TELE|nr:prostaglandin E synthase [Takifugu rubripes]XP_056873946.1 prostaglandin E synthase isoform X1 [Takifugu flavidus]TWW66377.1 Prostaglandin E synthase [Takifugu flavidus]
MCHHHFRGWRRIKSLASLVQPHFHALSKRVTQTLIAMIVSEVFSCFAFYGALLVIKMYIIAIITGQVRLRRKAFANPEDALRHGGLQYQRCDSYVERCRRAHVNDMENILPFLFLGAIYSMTGPSLAAARLHFLVFTFARGVHTIAYLCALRAPTRSVAYTLAQVPCVSMAVQILITVAAHA